MIVPKVHMNGTSARELIAQISAANNALEDAIEALIKMRPNGRDYYLTGDLRQAEQEHQARLDAVLKVQAEIMAIGEKIAEQE
jgi:hypothetical protein